jgi:hypothetical protein
MRGREREREQQQPEAVRGSQPETEPWWGDRWSLWCPLLGESPSGWCTEVMVLSRQWSDGGLIHLRWGPGAPGGQPLRWRSEKNQGEAAVVVLPLGTDGLCSALQPAH